MGDIKATLIISFYNNFKFLEFVFAGLECQTFKDFEVIIADDGSSPEIVQKIKEKIKVIEFPIYHIWHEDIGWRKNIILNQAIKISNSNYLIFIDGDCIPHPRFIEEHYKNKENKTVLAGRRVNLSKQASNFLTAKIIKNKILRIILLLFSFLLKLFGQGSHIENGIYIKSRLIRKYLNKKEKGIVGSNFSIHKSDILDINGFDERFLFPAAGEDTDIRNRLKNNSIRIKSLKHIAVQYHIYHPRLKRNLENLKILNENLLNKLTFTPFGIVKS